MVVILLGIVTDESELQLENEKAPIFVSVLGNETEDND